MGNEEKQETQPAPTPVPEPLNLDQLERQRRANDKKKVKRSDFIITPENQGLNIPL